MTNLTDKLWDYFTGRGLVITGRMTAQAGLIELDEPALTRPAHPTRTEQVARTSRRTPRGAQAARPVNA